VWIAIAGGAQRVAVGVGGRVLRFVIVGIGAARA
jgi:hypothetical protein